MYYHDHAQSYVPLNLQIGCMYKTSSFSQIQPQMLFTWLAFKQIDNSVPPSQSGISAGL